MMGIPIPEFKVLLYGPGAPPAGIQALARFEGSALTLIGRDMVMMTPVGHLTLTRAGFDGRQWLICWQAPEGKYWAVLRDERALRAFIEAAPKDVGQQLEQSRKTLTRASKLLRTVLLLALLLLLLLLWGQHIHPAGAFAACVHCAGNKLGHHEHSASIQSSHSDRLSRKFCRMHPQVIHKHHRPFTQPQGKQICVTHS